MKSMTYRFNLYFLLTSLLITLTACGGGSSGGGSGSSDDSSSSGSSYSGKTTSAKITAENADDFAIPVLDGGISSNGLNPYNTATSSTSSKKEQRAAILSILAEQTKNQVGNFIQQKNSVNTAATTTNGSCGGSYTYTDNSTSSNINILFSYDNYCTGSSGAELKQSGTISVTGSYTRDSNDKVILSTLTLTMTNISATLTTNSGTTTETFSGSMTITFDGTIANSVVSISVSMNLVINGLTFKVENYVIKELNNTLTIQGRFYHPTHGYVDITTTEPFDLYSNYPKKYCSGTLHIVGSGGVVDFTADASCSTYDLCHTPTGGAESCTTSNAWPQ